MRGPRGENRLENSRRLQLVGERLVGWQRGGHHRDGVEDLRFGVGRLPRGERAHRAFVGQGTCSLIDALVVLEQFADGGDVQLLALGRARAESCCRLRGAAPLLEQRASDDRPRPSGWSIGSARSPSAPWRTTSPSPARR